MCSMKNPYRILNILVGSDVNVAKLQYYKIAKKYHPDTTSYDKKFALQKIQEINAAFQIIKNSTYYTAASLRPKGRFTKKEIEEIIKRFEDGQSIYKIGREMKRRQKSIVKLLIRLGLMEEPYYPAERELFFGNSHHEMPVLTIFLIIIPEIAIIYFYIISLRKMLM